MGATIDGQAKHTDLMGMVKVLWPLVVGLACGRCGLIVSCYGSYAETDLGLYTDGAMLVSLVVLLVPFVILSASKKTLPPRAVEALAVACIALEAVSIFALAALAQTGYAGDGLRFFVSVVCTIASSGAIFFWLRNARGAGTVMAVVFAFSALILSEVILFADFLLPSPLECLAAGVLALVQFPCMREARRRPPLSEVKIAEARPADAFGITKDLLANQQVLIASAVSIGMLSVVIGFLRGYPNGQAIPFTFATRSIYAALTIACSAVVIARVCSGHRRFMSEAIFAIMQLLACVALICYAAFPSALDIGAVFATTLNALMVGFTWYMIVAFMTAGWRDPYYYALAGWFVWLGARSCTRMLLLAYPQVPEDDILTLSVIATFIVVSAQATLIMLLHIERENHKRENFTPEEAEAMARKQSESALVRVMGLENADNLTAMRAAAMRNSAEIVGRQFLLSERETEVLALYALGYTQKRVAEELFITPSTTHAHIKRIYAKTGMHSRQEILDYIEQYAS